MKANKHTFRSALLIIVVFQAINMNAATLITSGLDNTDKIMRILLAVAGLITLLFLNFYRRKGK